MAECPHPEKVAHATQGAALAALDSLERARGIDFTIKAYPCGDHWHLGHSRVRGDKAIRKALADGRRRSREARRRRSR